MSVCGADGEEEDGGKKPELQRAAAFSMPVAINALTHSSSWAQASVLTAGTMENKEWPFYDGNLSLMWITLFYFSHCLE